MGLCTDDNECNPFETNRLCYVNISGFDSDSLDENGCACNTFYGWDGENCDEFSASTWTSIVWMGLCLFIGVLIVVRSASMLVVLVHIEKESKTKETCFSKLKPRLLTNIFALAAAVGYIIWALSVILSLVDTSGTYLVGWWAEIDRFKGKYTFIALFGGPIGVFFTMLTLCNVAIMWIDIAYKTIKMNANYTRMYTLNKRFLYGLQVVGIFTALAVYAYELLGDGTSVDGFFFPVIELIVFTWYIIAYIKISAVLQRSSLDVSNKSYRGIFLSIRRTTLAVCVFIFLHTASVLTFSLIDTFGDTWKQGTGVGEFSLTKAAHHCNVLFGVSLVLCINEYLVSSLRQSGSYTSRMGCVWVKGTGSDPDARRRSSIRNSYQSNRENSRFSFSAPFTSSKRKSSYRDPRVEIPDANPSL